MQAAMAEIVGKKELCALLKWSRPRLDRRLTEDPRFPVDSRGDQSGGWRFCPKKVQRYLGGAQEGIGSKPNPVPASAPKSASKGIDLAQLRDTVKKPLPKVAEETAVQVVEALKNAPEPKSDGRRKSAYHAGEAGARQRKDEAQAAILENKLRLENAELVRASDVRQALSTVFARLGHDLDGLPEKIVKALDLREDAAPGIRAMIDQVRTEMVRGAEPLLVATQETAP